MISPLYIYWQPDEIAFHIGSLAVRWYGLCWLMGLALAFFLMKWLYRQHRYSDDLFDPLFLYVFIGVLVGGRLGHCLFYEPDYFLSSPTHMLEMVLPIHFLEGGGWRFTGYAGLASHGGVIGLLIGLYLYLRRTKMRPWVVLDFMGVCSCITATFIRLGNLMNSEIIGNITDVPWAFIFARVDQAPRHPGQLYEALAYFVFFWIILAVYRWKREKVGTGFFFGLCLTLVFAFRFVIEYTKEVQESFESTLPLDMGQILSIPFIIIGVWAMIQSRGKKGEA